MSDSMTTTELRAQIYRVIDEVLETGQPRRIRRGDQAVIIAPETPPRRLDLARLPRRTAIACTPDELVAQGFTDTWRPDP